MLEISVYAVALILIMTNRAIAKCNRAGFFLLGLYTFIAVMAVCSVAMGLVNPAGSRIWPYLLLIACYLIALYPLLREESRQLESSIDFKLPRFYTFFAVVYIVAAIVMVACYLPSVLGNLQSGEFSLNRRAYYSGEIVSPYRNSIDHYCSLFASYMYYLAITVSFFLFTDASGKRVKLGIALLISAVSTQICMAVFTSSRGSIFIAGCTIAAVYLLLKSRLPGKSKYAVIILAVICLAFTVPYVLNVTEDRFSYSSTASNSLVQYFGEPPVVFNTGVSVIDDYMYGANVFGVLFDLSKPLQGSIGGSWGTRFYTFVGWFFLDWGVIGALIGTSVFAFAIAAVLRKRPLRLSDVYILVFYINEIVNGAFVLGDSAIIVILFNVCVYLALRICVDNPMNKGASRAYSKSRKAIYTQEKMAQEKRA